MALAVLGIGSVCALGSGVDTLHAGLKKTIKPQPTEVPFETAKGKTTIPVYRAMAEGLDRFIPKRALRRVDPFARMALLSSHLAVEDSALKINDRSRLGIVFASAHGAAQTTFSFLDGIIDDGDNGASPTLFANSVHNALAAQVSIHLKATGPCTTITSFERSTQQALFVAEQWLNSGQVDYVLAGFGDEYCPVLGYAVANAQSVKDSSCNYRPGEGHVTFLMGRSDVQAKYGLLDTQVEMHKKELAADGDYFLADNGGPQSSILNRPAESHKKLTGSLALAAPFEIAFAALQACEYGRVVICLEPCGEDLFNCYRVIPKDGLS